MIFYCNWEGDDVTYLLVGLGGMFGALSRYGLGSFVSQLIATPFPFGTLSINLLGSFLLSFIVYGSTLKWHLPKKYLLAINTGFVGSFTTFSTLSAETLSLINDGKYMFAISYALISLIAGLMLSWLGIYTSSKLYPKVESKRGNY